MPGKRPLYWDIGALILLALFSSGYESCLILMRSNSTAFTLKVFATLTVAAYIWPAVRAIARGHWSNSMLAVCGLLMLLLQVTGKNNSTSLVPSATYFLSIPMVCLSFSYLRLPFYMLPGGLLVVVLTVFQAEADSYNAVLRAAAFLSTMPMLVWYLRNRSRFWCAEI